jgi:Carboxylesterase family
MMWTSSLVYALASASIFSLANAEIEPGSPTARIDAGFIIGTSTTLPSTNAVVNKFLGIPFADSPPGRFSPPVRPGQWFHPLDTTEYKPACIQQFNGKWLRTCCKPCVLTVVSWS